MEQLVARWAHNPKVTGSSPVPATKVKPLIVSGFLVFKQIRTVLKQREKAAPLLEWSGFFIGLTL
jgi:hypothetical protein